MYPGEGMYVGDEPVHRHHLPKMDDDDDDDNEDSDHHHHHGHDHEHDHGHNPYPGHQHHNHPPRNTPPPPRHHPTPPKRTRTPTATPSLRPQQPLQPPTPLNPPSMTLQPPTPLCPPVPLQPPTPLPPQPPLQFQPPPQLQQRPPDSPPTPRKPHPPPLMDLNHPHHYNDGDDDDDEDKYPQRQIGAIVFILLLLFGLTALILWLIYRPSKPQFTAVATLIYSLNTTTGGTGVIAAGAPATVAASMQFVIHTRNPNKRTALSYDHLTATVYYRDTAITPPVSLPPLYHRKKSSVIIAPVIGGPTPAVAVAVATEVAEEIAASEAYGVIGFSWVVVGRVRYRAGGFKSGHSRVYVRCDVVVRLSGVNNNNNNNNNNNGVYINPGGQVPLLASPPCLVDI